MISRQYCCIYIHIPKTAGTSIGTSFGFMEDMRKRGAQDHRSIRNIKNGIWPDSGSLEAWIKFVNQRAKGRRYDFVFVTKEEFKNFFKFTFVRNPFDRVYSWYRNVIRDELHQKELAINCDIKFPEFVQKYLDIWALRPQLTWITDEKGEVAVDYIGKFESLDKDYQLICERIGKPLENLPKTLHYEEVSYRHVYDRQSRLLVAEKYAEEIELFGYAY